MRVFQRDSNRKASRNLLESIAVKVKLVRIKNVGARYDYSS
jgi:hypothetical protein